MKGFPDRKAQREWQHNPVLRKCTRTRTSGGSIGTAIGPEQAPFHPGMGFRAAPALVAARRGNGSMDLCLDLTTGDRHRV